MALFKLIKSFIPERQIPDLIRETFLFKQVYYNEENLERHVTYPSDTTLHRTSHAYAVTCFHPFTSNAKHFSYDPLPVLNLDGLPEFPSIWTAYMRTRKLMGLDADNRMLFNVQEYYGGSEAVPQHNDGELLDFNTDGGKLNIKRSIRPDLVCVITLVNDTDGGGTRVHFPDGTEEVVRGEAGDLLVFNNALCLHSVDALSGTVKRSDGLLRMTCGFRSLASRCQYMEGSEVWPISKLEAELMTKQWYNNEWPAKWASHKASSAKAAF